MRRQRPRLQTGWRPARSDVQGVPPLRNTNRASYPMASMSSKTEQRAKEILQLLLKQGRTTVEDLTERFATSPASIRRDLVRLEQRGLVHRTHGGAMLAGQTYEPFRFDASFNTREGRFVKEKQRIAAAAADLVRTEDTVGITAGTTTTQLARVLRGRSGIHVLTNAVNVAMELSSSKGVETTLTGGCIRWPGAFSLVGPATLETVKLTVLDKLFVAVCGIDPRFGATTIQAEEAAVFRAMCGRSRQIIVMADSSKVGMLSPAVICPIEDIDCLITDDGIPEDAVKRFRDADVQVIVAR
jgi:DeoR family transcriptional regulator of aga operon